MHHGTLSPHQKDRFAAVLSPTLRNRGRERHCSDRSLVKVRDVQQSSMLRLCRFQGFRGVTMQVLATILAHEAVEPESGELHRFIFSISDELNTEPVRNVVSLHTARVLARELIRDTAVAQMIVTIVGTDPADYDSLVGKAFRHT